MPLLVGLISDLISDEGVRACLYDDATGKPIKKGTKIIGNPTIGVGRCLTTNPLKEDEIAYLLKNDCNSVIDWCYSNLPFFAVISDERKRAVANMVYQLGGDNFLEFKDAIAALNKLDFETASKEILDSAYAKQSPKRAERIAKIILSGKI